MNGFKPNEGYPLNAQWSWKTELLGTQETAPHTDEGKLVRVNERLTHFTDSTGEKVYLVLHGTPPTGSDAELLRTASAMEDALLHERANRLPIY